MRPSIPCPGCGAAITLASSATVFVTCPYCRSTLVHDKDWTLHGKAAELPPEVTYLQVGTKGKYNNETFEIIGRRRLRWEDGYWSEWCALFPKGQIAWLAEAQGTYALGFETGLPDPLPSKNAHPGTNLSFEEHGLYIIDDNKEASIVGTEGEMPYLVDATSDVVTLDGSNKDGGFCSLEFNKKTREWSAFVGRYLNFDEFQFQNLRELDGW